MAKIDMTNQRFGKLIVLKDSGKRLSGNILWECQCDCGNIFLGNGRKIRNGTTKSCPECAHKNNQKKDLIGKRFGKLTVLDISDKKSYLNTTYQKCQCDCGRIVEVDRRHLISGHTQSCGHCNLSKGELKIANILKENLINFEQQKTFESCRFLDTNYLAKFDFYLPDYNLLIEYDGEQHFSPLENSWNNLNKFNKIIAHDNFKNEWALKNNIRIKHIPYYDYNKINLEYILN